MTPNIAELIERLRAQGRTASRISKTMAQAKSLRQDHDPPRDDLYMWQEPEQTLEWKAADTIEALSDRVTMEEGREVIARAALERIAEGGGISVPGPGEIVFEEWEPRKWAREALATLSRPEGGDK